jgi:hypothetical protein
MNKLAEVVEWLLLDRRSYEENVLRCWPSVCAGVEPSHEENNLNTTLTCLVATHHGKHRVEEIDKNPNIEVVQLEYGQGCQVLPVSQSCWTSQNQLLVHSRCKGEMMRLAIEALNHKRSNSDYLAFIDDDVNLSVLELHKAACSAKKYGMHAYQLAYSKTEDSVWSDLLKCNSGHRWQSVPFVEIMAPVISRTAVPVLRTALEGSISGFGIDYYLQPVLQRLIPNLRFGVWCEATMSHERPINTTGDKVFDNGLSASGEEERLRAALLCTLMMLGGDEHITLAKICRHLKRQLRTSTSGQSWRPVFEAAFNTTTHRHWSWVHDEQRLDSTQRKLSTSEELLKRTQAELISIKNSKAWQAATILRKIGSWLK